VTAPSSLPWSPSRAREELRAAIGRASRELIKTPPTAPGYVKVAQDRIAKLQRALVEDWAVNTPAAMAATLEAIDCADAGLLALLAEHGEGKA